jgi:[ribosomal protein S5]-alanine N-acetyltransferase
MSVLETERMILREMSMDDTENLLTIFSDPEAMRFYPGTKDVAETQGWIQWNLNSYEQYGHGLWIAEFKETGQFAGQCGLIVQNIEGCTEVEIGYSFRRQLWGQGLATEAAQACRDHGFERLGLSRLISLIAPGNLASRRVAEKVGMTLERQIVKWNKDICLYSKENTP